MIQSGELPNGEICPYSHRPANCTVYFHVQCERSWVRGGDNDTSATDILFILVIGWIGLLFSAFRSRPREEHGRETSIELPLRVSGNASAKIVSLRQQKKLNKLLREVPIYAELLKEFPDAKVQPLSFAECHSDSTVTSP
ncbi:hypothetical protein [Aeoliella mucimassa]|nr:hypothetical protein [Aeoliella mucimassa]